jgi:hypothetical protein
MPQYIVLQPISPEQGPLILPAQPDRAAPDVVPPPVLVDDTVISAEAAPILIAAGVLVLLEAGDVGREASVESQPKPKRKP